MLPDLIRSDALFERIKVTFWSFGMTKTKTFGRLTSEKKTHLNLADFEILVVLRCHEMGGFVNSQLRQSRRFHFSAPINQGLCSNSWKEIVLEKPVLSFPFKRHFGISGQFFKITASFHIPLKIFSLRRSLVFKTFSKIKRLKAPRLILTLA